MQTTTTTGVFSMLLVVAKLFVTCGKIINSKVLLKYDFYH